MQQYITPAVILACLLLLSAAIPMCKSTNDKCASGTVQGMSVDYSRACMGDNTNTSAIVWSCGFSSNPGDTYVVYRTITTTNTVVTYNISYFDAGRQIFWRGENVTSLDAMVVLDNINIQLDANYLGSDSNASALFRFGYVACGIRTTSQTPLVNVNSVIVAGPNTVQVYDARRMKELGLCYHEREIPCNWASALSLPHARYNRCWMPTATTWQTK